MHINYIVKCVFKTNILSKLNVYTYVLVVILHRRRRRHLHVRQYTGYELFNIFRKKNVCLYNMLTPFSEMACREKKYAKFVNERGQFKSI